MQEYLAIASGVAGGLVVSFKVLRWAYKAVHDVQEKLDIITGLSRELVPNGGSSLRDSVNRVEASVVSLTSKLRMIVELNEWDAFESDHMGNWINVTGNFNRVCGLHDLDLLGFGWLNAVHPDDRKRVNDEYQMAIRQERDWICKFGVRHITTGVTQEYRIRAQCLRLNGQLLGYHGLIEKDYSEEETLDRFIQDPA